MPDYRQSLMYKEAMEAPDAVARLIQESARAIANVARALQQNPPTMVITCARGSSDHAATFAKYCIETRLGWVTASAAPSVRSVYRADLHIPAGCLFIAISQSGASPDLVESLRYARTKGARTLAIVNVPDSPLAQAADWTISLCAGPEKSVAATKSYICSLAAIAALVHGVQAAATDGPAPSPLLKLPAALRAAQALDWSPLADALQYAKIMLVLGRGAGFGVAQEAALKLKETCGIHAEAFSTAELRHGPMALAATGVPMLIFRPDDAAAAGVDALIGDLVAMRSQPFVIGPCPDGARALPHISADPLIAPIVQIQSFYLMVAQLAFARGLNPDVPPLLKKVTETI